MHRFLILLFLGCCSFTTAQNRLTGLVVDENHQPLHGGHIHSNFENTLTNRAGIFEIGKLPHTDVQLHISYLGYQSVDTIISVHRDTYIELQLLPEDSSLDEVVITSTRNGLETINKEQVDDTYLRENYSGSLAASLQRLPGVNASEIGAGASRPIVRGLGLNRVAVAENGIKHEGQQWGADHGLEIDAFAAEEVEVIKTGGAIIYGSDAIGGVVVVKNDLLPEQNSFSGSYTALGRSANHTFANSLSLKYRKNKFFYKIGITTSDYGDYNVPTDRIVYLTVQMPVYNNRLKNTAGRERNLFGQIGYVGERSQTTLTATNTYLKAGFFPGAHGVPSIGRVEDDGDRRNIEFPHQRTNHLKLNYKTTWFFDGFDLSVQTGYQNNRRQEYSAFHTHFGNQDPPERNPDLELDFNLHTWDANIITEHRLSERHKLRLGVQAQWQQNNIAGYNFLLPEYRRQNVGAYALFDYEPNPNWVIHFGGRADWAHISINSFFDPILYEYLIGRDRPEADAQAFALRSQGASRRFQNNNLMAGAAFRPNEHWGLSLTTQTHFRLPSAIELAANGIHHGSFRHEQGDPNLSTERGITLDAKAGFAKKNTTVSLSPFVYYFDNYIFLRPSGSFSPLPHGGQIYQFTESGALLSGVELTADQQFAKKWHLHTTFEYLYNQQYTGQRSRNYPLPFSPPINGFAELRYAFQNSERGLRNTSVAANTNLAWRQERTAQNEQPTPGYALLGAEIKSELHIGKLTANLSLRATNLLDKRYFNHTNFYRALEIPEMGRNIQLMIQVPLG